MEKIRAYRKGIRARKKKGKKICYDRKHKGMRDRIKEVSFEWLGNLAEKM